MAGSLANMGLRVCVGRCCSSRGDTVFDELYDRCALDAKDKQGLSQMLGSQRNIVDNGDRTVIDAIRRSYFSFMPSLQSSSSSSVVA